MIQVEHYSSENTKEACHSCATVKPEIWRVAFRGMTRGVMVCEDCLTDLSTRTHEARIAFQITPHRDEILRLCRLEDKIVAIRLIRQATSLDYAEARQVYDALKEESNRPPSSG